MEQTLCQRAAGQQLHAGGTCALTHNGDVLRVTAEGGDVVLDPPDGGQLVKQTVVAGMSGFLLQLGQAGKAPGAQAVVDGHTYNAPGWPDGTVKMLFVAAAAGVAAAVDVHQHRHLFLDSFRSEDIEEQTILAVGEIAALAELIIVENFLLIFCLCEIGSGLVAGGTVLGGIVHALPACDGLGIFPAACGGIADTLIGYGARHSAGAAPDIAAGGRNDIVHIARPFLRYGFWRSSLR